jgi:glutathione synthase/RimK-type ligase-like ATP-grasp enzyme
MAIFSQNDEKTIVDWRNYNHDRPNRKIPFKLPLEVENNIRKFIKASGLNTGAIDMVVTKGRKYVFLECNPNGQISMVSEHCNYFIEKYIADYLSTP